MFPVDLGLVSIGNQTSQSELPIDDIIAAITNALGSFLEKLIAALGSRCVPNNEISFNRSTIAFSTSSSKTVVPIIVEIQHGK